MSDKYGMIESGGYLIQLYPKHMQDAPGTHYTSSEQAAWRKELIERGRLFITLEGDPYGVFGVDGELSSEQQAFADRWKAEGHTVTLLKIPEGWFATRPGQPPYYWKIYKHEDGNVTLKLPWLRTEDYFANNRIVEIAQ